MQHLSALAVVHGLASAAVGGAGGAEESKVELKLKWPNDVYVRRTDEGDLIKMGGVLTASSFCGGTAVCNIGVGFNLNNASPTVCLNRCVQVTVLRSKVKIHTCQSKIPVCVHLLLSSYKACSRVPR